MTLKQYNIHFIDLNVKAIPLHLERVFQPGNKLVSGLAHVRFNYLSPFRIGNLIILCCFLYGVERAMNRNCSSTKLLLYVDKLFSYFSISFNVMEIVELICLSFQFSSVQLEFVPSITLTTEQ